MVSLAITSGKGGVGKTNVVVNLAVSLGRMRHRVVVLDADFGLGNVDVLLGLAPESHLGHVLSGEKTIHEILVDGPEGIRVIPASSGLQELTVLSNVHWDRLSAGLRTLSHECDFLLIDTAAGIADNVLEMLAGSERVLIVTSPEPTAVVDAYALIKVMTHLRSVERYRPSRQRRARRGRSGRRIPSARNRGVALSQSPHSLVRVRRTRPGRSRVRLRPAAGRVPPPSVSGQPLFPHAGLPCRRAASVERARSQACAPSRDAAGSRHGPGGPSMRMTATEASTSVDRDQLVINHVGLVKVMAHRLAQRLPSQVEMSDLISVGVLGLIDAAGRYRPAMGVPFDALRAPPRAGRDARRAARPRLGPTLAAPHAPRHRRRDGEPAPSAPT